MENRKRWNDNFDDFGREYPTVRDVEQATGCVGEGISDIEKKIAGAGLTSLHRRSLGEHDFRQEVEYGKSAL